MNIQLLILLNSALLGASNCLLAFGGKRTVFLLIIFTWIVTALNSVTLDSIFDLRKISSRAHMRLLWITIMLFAAYFLIRQFGENLIATKTMDPLLKSVIILVQNSCYLWMLCSILIWSKRLSFPEALVVMLVSIGVFAGLNLLADTFLPRESNEFGDSRFEGLARWMPPMARSNGLFSVMCVVCAGTSINLLVRWKCSTLCWFLRVLVFISTMLALIAAFRCQFRAQLITITVACFLAFVPSLSTLRLLLILAFGCMLAFPALFATKVGIRFVESLPIDQALEMIGSKSNNSATLSGRTEIYSYGWQRLATPEVFLLGEGPVLRNALKGVRDNAELRSSIDYRLPYHSSCIDTLVQHGALIGAFVLLILLFFGLQLTKSITSYNLMDAQQVMVPSVMLILFFTVSIMDGGLAAFESLFFAIVSGFAALCWRERLEFQTVKFPSNANSHARHFSPILTRSWIVSTRPSSNNR